MPNGVPDCVPPSSEKIDLIRLKGDIPKFYNSRYFDDSHIKWWTDFLNDNQGIFKTPEKAATWPLVDIILIKQRQRAHVADTPHESVNDVLQIPRPPNAPPEIEKLVAEQVDGIPQVSKTKFTRTPMNIRVN